MKRKMSYSLLWLMLGAIVIQTGSQKANAQFGPHTPNSNWHAVGNTMVGAGVLWGAATPYCGVVGAPGIAGCAIGAGALTGGGLLLNFLSPSDAPNGGFPPNQPLLNNIQDGGSGPGFCDLACQAGRNDSALPAATPSSLGDTGCSLWWGCIAQMEGARLTIKLPPTHPVRSTLGSMVPRPDWRGFVVNEWMAPHYRTVLTRLRR